MIMLVRWGIRIGAASIAILAVALAVLTARSSPMPAHPFTDNTGVLAIAHRGGRGLWPENTMYAFEQAARMGVDVLEFDVHRTRDGQMVVIHDDRVDRTTDGTGVVEDMNYPELARLDAGYRWTADYGATFPFRGRSIGLATFEAVLSAFPGHRMNIELKTPGAEASEQFVALLRRYDRADRTLIASFNNESIDAIQSAFPDMAFAVTARNAFIFLLMHTLRVDFAFSPSQQALQIPPNLMGLTVVTPRLVRQAHAHNLDVHVWTINDPQEMKRLLDTGVDGIMTDYPDRLLNLLGRDVLP